MVGSWGDGGSDWQSDADVVMEGASSTAWVTVLWVLQEGTSAVESRRWVLGGGVKA